MERGYYELIEEYGQSISTAERITAKIMDNLGDRKGIKQAIHSVDGDVMNEIFETLTDLVEQEIA